MKTGDKILFLFWGKIVEGTVVLSGKKMVSVEYDGKLLIIPIDKIVK